MSEELKLCPTCGLQGVRTTESLAFEGERLYGCDLCGVYAGTSEAWNALPRDPEQGPATKALMTKIVEDFENELQQGMHLIDAGSYTREEVEAFLAERRRGFTLPELLVVLAIAAILLVGLGRVLVHVTADMRLTTGAKIALNQLVEARSQALASGSAGVRLVPDQLAPLARLADGTLDPSQVLTYSRIVPLVQPRLYKTGLVSIYVGGYPSGFTPAPGRLVLEESPVDSNGMRCDPTNWWGTIRVGDLVEVASHTYVVTGPMVLGPTDGNPTRHVNIGPQGTVSPLLRPGALKDEIVPVEFLYLANRFDDDRDGFTDEGHDGIDNNLDKYGPLGPDGKPTGLVDEDAEWEVETWRGTADSGLLAASYSIRPRLVPDESRGDRLPASVVIDATSWADGPVYHKEPGWTDSNGGYHAQPGFDNTVKPKRSRLPVDPYTGDVDLVFDQTGPVDSPSIYGRPANRPLTEGYLHLWVSGIADVASPPPATGEGRIVTLDLSTGQAWSGFADAGDVAGTFSRAEGGSR